MRTWEEVYEHDQYGEISIVWKGGEPTRSHMIAMQSELWTPAEEVQACLKWVREQIEVRGVCSRMESDAADDYQDNIMPRLEAP